jgi:predicted transcriptional regulator
MPEVIQGKKELDDRAMQIVKAVFDQLGGIGDLVKRRKTDMLPLLIESAFILVLSEEAHKSPEEIAEILDLSPSLIQSVLEAPLQGVEERLRYVADEMHEFELHIDPEWTDMPSTGHLEPAYITGALVKNAFTLIRREEGTIKSYPG